LRKKRGQLAHINRKRNDNRQENLPFLCLPHHDEYDTKRSQSKGLTPGELRKYVTKLYVYFDSQVPKNTEPAGGLFAEYQSLVQPRWHYVYEKSTRSCDRTPSHPRGRLNDFGGSEDHC